MTLKKIGTVTITKDSDPQIKPDPTCPWCRLGWPSKDHPVQSVCGVEE